VIGGAAGSARCCRAERRGQWNAPGVIVLALCCLRVAHSFLESGAAYRQIMPPGADAAVVVSRGSAFLDAGAHAATAVLGLLLALWLVGST